MAPPSNPPRLILREAEGEGEKHPGQWVSVDDHPKQRNISKHLALGELLRSVDPSTLHGLDRLRFVSATSVVEGNLIIEHESVPVTVLVEGDQPVVHLGGETLVVTPIRWLQGEDAQSARARLVKTILERQRRGTRLRERAAARDEHGIMTLPSETGQVLGMPLSKSGTTELRKARLGEVMSIETTLAPADIRGVRRVVGAMVTVELDPLTRSNILESRKRKKKGATLQLALPFDQVSGQSEDLPELAWRVLANLDTSTLLTLMAGMHLSIMGDGTFTAAPSVIGHARGLIGPSGKLEKKQRRELQSQLEMLRLVVLRVTPYGKEYRDTLPLLIEVGTRKVKRKGEAPLYAVQPQLMHRLMRGRALVMDRRVLAFKPMVQEWPLRIYWHFCTRWSMGWVGEKLHAGDGMVAVKLPDLLDRAGLADWREMARTRGEPEVLRRVADALRQLEDYQGGPMLHAKLVEGSGIGDSVVEAKPPATLAAQLTSSRSRTIGTLERVEAKPLPTPATKKSGKKRGTAGARAGGPA